MPKRDAQIKMPDDNSAESTSQAQHSRTWLVEALGWYGIAAILIAYALVSFDVILSDSLSYQLLNLTGALGVVVVSLAKKAAQPAVLNIIWAIVALVAIISLFSSGKL